MNSLHNECKNVRKTQPWEQICGVKRCWGSDTFLGVGDGFGWLLGAGAPRGKAPGDGKDIGSVLQDCPRIWTKAQWEIHLRIAPLIVTKTPGYTCPSVWDAVQCHYPHYNSLLAQSSRKWFQDLPEQRERVRPIVFLSEWIRLMDPFFFNKGKILETLSISYSSPCMMLITVPCFQLV